MTNPGGMRAACLLVALVCQLGLNPPARAVQVGTGFTYQGHLTDGDVAANGGYDVRFTLHACDVTGAQVGGTIELDQVAVESGVFTVELDFGDVFTGEARCLEIGVRPGSASGGAPYTLLEPRQMLTAAPHALYALAAAETPWGGLTGVPAGFLDGTDDNTTYAEGPGLTRVDNQFRVDFAGSGSAQTVARSDHRHDGAYWELDGNPGTNPGTHFLGTLDNAALQLHVGNARALRLEPGATSPNLLGGHAGNGVIAGVQGAAIAGGGSVGAANRVTDQFGTIAGGSGNQAGDDSGTTENSDHATVGGGTENKASGPASTVAGGADNAASAAFATVAGGSGGVNSGSYAFIGGGFNARASGQYAVIGGGANNVVGGQYGTVGGGIGNTADDQAATVGGGTGNNATGIDATVGGGNNNDATGNEASVGGGSANTASGFRSTVGGGRMNVADDVSGTVSGGQNNTASGVSAVVSGGGGNVADGTGAVIGGGSNNAAAGDLATVPGGADNSANADYSFAAGRRAKAGGHQGAFVWADSTNADFVASAPDQFAVRASNGLRLSADAGPSKPIGVGERYRDNAVVAWAKVRIDADQPVLQEEFGVSTVTRSGPGNYGIAVNAAAGAADRLVPLAVAELDAAPAAAADLRIVSIDQIDANTFRIYINQGTGPPVDNDFVFMVTAR